MKRAGLRRRLLGRAAVAVGLGLATTLVIAWWRVPVPTLPVVTRVDHGLAVADGLIVKVTISRFRFGESQSWEIRDPRDGSWDSGREIKRAERIAAEGGEQVEAWLIESLRGVSIGGRSYPPVRRIDDFAAKGPPRGLLDEPVRPGGSMVHVGRTGWPLRAVEAVTRSHMEYGPLSEHGVPTSATPVMRTSGVWELPWTYRWGGPPIEGTKIMLPVGVVWPGMLVNTAVFVAGWWVVLAAPGAVRRRVRLVRGACVRCGYDLRGQRVGGCPECGRGRLGGDGG